MVAMNALGVCLLTLFTVLVGCVASCSKCPPPGFDSVKDFRPKEFVKHSWYVQEQMVVAHQWLSTFFCAVATYEPKDEHDLLKGVKVYNYANKGKVNGPQLGTSGSGRSSGWFSQLEVVIPNAKDPSKLRVGLSLVGRVLPRLLLPAFYAPYWVVAVSEDSDGNYNWAIISAGPPEVKTRDGCKTSSDLLSPFQSNGAGLWFMSRKPFDPAATKEMRSTAKNLGFDISNVFPVDQEGCLYEGAVLK